jgi:iron complex transport system ATP-binding protein
MILEAREISVRYGRAAPALDRVSCAVSAARLVAVAGPNGSGKTTLVRALTGLVPLDTGEVLVEGRPVRRWPRSELARVLGVVPQREELAFPLLVEETVLLGRYARLGPLAAPSRADRQAVEAALERCDVAGLARRTVDSLSGGEWQRVRLARALAQEPRALVLDEPTASLDIAHEMTMFELLRGLALHDGVTVLLVTHALNLAARYADRLTLLDRGLVVASGEADGVLARETIERVYRWPVAILRHPGPGADTATPQIVPLARPPRGAES